MAEWLTNEVQLMNRVLSKSHAYRDRMVIQHSSGEIELISVDASIYVRRMIECSSENSGISIDWVATINCFDFFPLSLYTTIN